MLYANKADSDKIHAAVMSILGQAKSASVKTVFVYTRSFMQSCKLSSLKAIHFKEEVSDALCSMEVGCNHGLWLFTELGDGMSVFLQLSTESGRTDRFVQSELAANTAIEVRFDLPE